MMDTPNLKAKFKKRLIKLRLRFLLSIVFLVFFITFLIFNTIYSRMFHDIQKSSENLLQQTQNTVEFIFEESAALTIGLNYNMDVENILRSSLSNYIVDLGDVRRVQQDIILPAVAGRRYVDSLYIYFINDYDRFISINGIQRFSTFPDQSWLGSFLSHDYGLTFWTEARSYKTFSFDKSTTDVITLYTRLPPGNGVIVLNLDKSFFEDQMDLLQFSEGQNLYVFNENHQLLLQNKISDNFPTVELQTYLEKLSSEHLENINTDFSYGGQQYYVCIHQSSLSKWSYVSVFPYSTIYRTSYLYPLMIGIIFWAIGALCTILVFVNVKKSSKNLDKITHMLQEIEAGNSLPDISDNIQGEYEYIASNIAKTYQNQMALSKNIDENKEKIRKLELDALQSQLSPHFLVNSLQSIYWMSFQFTKSRNSVSIMLENMTNILSYVLREKGLFVELYKEITQLKYYLNIQQIRYNFCFQVLWDIPEDLEHYHTLRFLLQPLVENSISHGFTDETKNQCIKIKIRNRENYLAITIIDNGTGISKDQLQIIQERLHSEKVIRGESIGIYNCNRRLWLLFGEEYRLKILSKVGYGTVCKLKLPII